jgi:lipopolysaccharide transport system ATP-binding protein
MTDIAIHAENLSKRFMLGSTSLPYKSLRESVVHGARTALGKLVGRSAGVRTPAHEIWALDEISFQIRQGEALGVIGRNGAGKSTLLKILSRITEPTHGWVDTYGSVGSLLEVGTGFHPELTGRENIFLNGAILGMSRAEVRDRFDAIVAFAEIEEFLDTPVKRYSSGMFTRLAFSVAAHLEPDILLVDEVLAVGDVEFQRKSLSKMSDVVGHGRTVLFVSHNMQAITDLCTRCIWIDKGHIAAEGEPEEVVRRYMRSGRHVATSGLIEPESHLNATGDVEFTRVHVLDIDGLPCDELFLQDPLRVRTELRVNNSVRNVRLIIAVTRLDGTIVGVFHDPEWQGVEGHTLNPGDFRAEMAVQLNLTPGEYTLELAVKPAPGYWGSGQTLDWVRQPIQFSVLDVARSGQAPLSTAGVVRPRATWRLDDVVDSQGGHVDRTASVHLGP